VTVPVAVRVGVAVVVPVEVTVLVGKTVRLMVRVGVGLSTAVEVDDGFGVAVAWAVGVIWTVAATEGVALGRLSGGRDVAVGDTLAATTIPGPSVLANRVDCSCTIRVDRAGSMGLNCSQAQGL
jgi:hypothetical protein